MMNSELAMLPDDFGIGPNDTKIYFYSNDKSSLKNRVTFTKNMICLLQHGIKEVQTAAGKKIITNADVLMLTNGSMLMSESVAAGNRYEAILVFFGNKTLMDFCAQRQVSITNNAADQSIFTVDQDEFLQLYAKSLRLLGSEINSELVNIKVQEILTYVAVKSPAVFQQLASVALSGNVDIKLRQVIERNADANLTLDELAFLCNKSLSTFKRHFAELYGISPQKYFIQRKMHHAKTLLSIGKRPTEVGAELGYESLPAFSTEFKKYYGISPKRFQRENAPIENASIDKTFDLSQ